MMSQNLILERDDFIKKKPKYMEFSIYLFDSPNSKRRKGVSFCQAQSPNPKSQILKSDDLDFG